MSALAPSPPSRPIAKLFGARSIHWRRYVDVTLNSNLLPRGISVFKYMPLAALSLYGLPAYQIQKLQNPKLWCAPCIRRKKFFSYYTIAKSPSTTFLYLWGSFTTTSTFPSLSSSNTTHFYCFPSNTASTTFHCPPLPPPPHTHTHCTHTLSAHFYCFPSTTSTTIVFTAPPPPRDILFWTSREQLLREKRIKHWPQEPTPTPLETASFAPHPLRILLPSVGGMNIFWNYTFPKKRNLKLRKDAIHYSSYLK